jgi:Fe2+ transport system protein FeoA
MSIASGGPVAIILPLDRLNAGEVGEVIDVCGNDRLVARLAENGLRKGTKLEMLANGNPFLVRVNDTKLSFRADGQVEILVSVPVGCS